MPSSSASCTTTLCAPCDHLTVTGFVPPLGITTTFCRFPASPPVRRILTIPRNKDPLMQLPDDAVGITDLIAYRDCPRRMSYGLRRHTGKAQQSDERTPEAGSYATAYGSAIHDAIQALEDGYDVEAAIQVAWNQWGSWLEPGDVDLLRHDLEVYLQRDFPNTRTIAAEDEFRIPLFVHQG